MIWSVSLIRTSVEFVIVLMIVFRTVECVKNCCPDDFWLNHIDKGPFSSDEYNCRKLSERNLTRTEVWLDGSSIERSVNDQIPRCYGASYRELTENTFRLSENSCVANLKGDIFAIECPQKDKIKTVQVSFVKKCCPLGMSYDFDGKSCYESDQTWRKVDHLLNHEFVFKPGSLDCAQDEVLVEYNSMDGHRIQFEGTTLIVNGYEFPPESYCVDGSFNSENNAQLLFRTCHSPSICDKIPCVRKCCKDMKRLFLTEEGPSCQDYYSSLPVNFHHYSLSDNGTFNATAIMPRLYGIVHELKCQKYPLDPGYDLDEHYINHQSGSLYMVADDIHYTRDMFCVDFAATSETEVVTFVCFDEPEVATRRYTFMSIGLMVSCCFLALTLVVYVCIPRLLNLPGKILMCQVISMFVAYLLLALLQFNNLLVTYCVQSAFVLYFSFLSTFSWLNVMCFDIWWTFGSIERAQGLRKSHQIKRFLLYSLYGWGYPFIWTILTFMIDRFQLAHPDFLPMIGENRCWFTRGARAPAHLVFFILPIGILVATNSVLFILTMKYCNKVKSEISRMQSNSRERVSFKKRFKLDKARFIMNTKLFVVMGISWLLEIVSVISATSEYIFYISDAANISQGILVFFIFVFKKNVLDEIKRRLGLLPKKYVYGTTVVSTNATSLTDLRLSHIKSIGSCQSLLQPPLSPLHTKRLSRL